jgi:hypothetical protein
MLRSVLIILCSVFFQCSAFAQFNLKGSWIKTGVTYVDSSELEDGLQIKFSYLKYTFDNPAKVWISFSFDHKGNAMKYSVKNQKLEMENDAGFVANEFLIEKCSGTELILRQKGIAGFDDPNSLRFYFTNEAEILKTYVASKDDIFSIINSDTVFLANQNLYPTFRGEKDYADVLKNGVGDQGSRNLYFLATYIVKKNGEADSLKILNSFDADFDKRIIKNFNKTKNNWEPGRYHGKPVDVQMKQEYRYFSSETMLPVFDYGSKGSKAMANKDFSSALYLFNKALEKFPDNQEILYKRAVCKHELGNIEGACSDLIILKQLGDKSANELLLKWCK